MTIATLRPIAPHRLTMESAIIPDVIRAAHPVRESAAAICRMHAYHPASEQREAPAAARQAWRPWRAVPAASHAALRSTNSGARLRDRCGRVAEYRRL